MSDEAKKNTAEIDVRTLPRSQRHRTVFDAYEKLAVDEALVLVNDHEPKGLQEEFERELAGAYNWEPVTTTEDAYRVRITKRASTALPRIVADTTALLEGTDSTTGGSIWQLEPGARDLDANIIALPSHVEIGMHVGPNLDVLIIVLQGSGQLHTELSVIELEQGQLLWLPRNAHRRFVAGTDGLRYFTVHHRKPTLNITTRQNLPGAP